MPHTPVTALRSGASEPAEPARISHLGGAGRPRPARATVAVLLTGCRDPAATVRGYRTVLPHAEVWLFGHDLGPGDRSAAGMAGAIVRVVPPSSRAALVRRMLAEADADVSLLVHGGGVGDVCVAPLAVAEVEAGRDLVDVCRLGAIEAGDAADRLLGRTVDWVFARPGSFGRPGAILRSDFQACSRRLAVSYRRAPRRPGEDDDAARALALHALRLRLPVSQVAALGATRPDPAPPPRDLAGWLMLLGLVARLLVEERPRRAFGLAGLAAVAAGFVTAVPALAVHRGPAMPLGGVPGAAALVLIGAGLAVGAAGLLLDALASARQEVRRLGVAAIPRRAADQSSQS